MSRRYVVGICGAIATFVVAVALTLGTWKGPHLAADYLVVGSLGAFAALAALFGAMTKTPQSPALPEVPSRVGRGQQITETSQNG